MILAIAATLAAVAIAITGLAPIVDRRWLWAAGVMIGVVAVGSLVYGVIGLIAPNGP